MLQDPGTQSQQCPHMTPHDPPTLISDWQTPHKAALGKQPDRRLASPETMPHIWGIPRAYSSGDQRGVHCRAAWDVSYKRPFFQDWEM